MQDPTAARFDFPGSGWILIDRAERKVWVKRGEAEPAFFPEFEVVTVEIRPPGLFGLLPGFIRIRNKFGEEMGLKLKNRSAHDEALRMKDQLLSRGGRVVSD